MYDRGYGVTKDYAQAAKWYQKSADAGNDGGMVNLGVSYYNGTGITKDTTLAISWLKKAAAMGNQKAKDNLKKLGY